MARSTKVSPFPVITSFTGHFWIIEQAGEILTRARTRWTAYILGARVAKTLGTTHRMLQKDSSVYREDSYEDIYASRRLFYPKLLLSFIK